MTREEALERFETAYQSSFHALCIAPVGEGAVECEPSTEAIAWLVGIRCNHLALEAAADDAVALASWYYADPDDEPDGGEVYEGEGDDLAF